MEHLQLRLFELDDYTIACIGIVAVSSYDDFIHGLTLGYADQYTVISADQYQASIDIHEIYNPIVFIEHGQDSGI